MSYRPPSVVRLDVVLHPVVLAALALLVLNDHLLKGRAPGWFTGKASDFAGLIVLPVIFAAAVSAAGAVFTRPGTVGPITSQVVPVGSIVIAAIGFASVKLSPSVADLYSSGITYVSRPLSFVTPHSAGSELRVRSDWTDLVALSALVLPGLLLCRTTPARPHPATAELPALRTGHSDR